MKKLCLILFSISLLASCKKNDDAKSQQRLLVTGLYKGTFSRSGLDTADISLSIVGNRFEGQGSHQNYPAICSGSFSENQSSITFQDSCAWPANFDWSLILNGRYEFSVDSKNVRIWRINGSSTDEYVLSRLTR
ncbi:hypothetical protein LZZ85_13995 [Terrimonas sp. NA20]|uniref:Lipoprotein n=1 Tax=Terrimonas ginsenosidimutans TaxID=2908004 RepID=A0ABS9KSY8_9BACT|nr:hypothetical protein [Terrimonas ginsenosidimutans]MCG2615407.1 hypothetical protein [Terrimonas ginsenosidimutans]